jgi:predicted flap endonuclease-1-like 5' DNA nuclease
VHAELNAVQEAIRNLRMPTMPPPVDIGPMQQRIDALEHAVRSIVIPPAATPVDLGPVLQKLSALESRAAQPVPAAAPAAPAPTPRSATVRAGSRNLLTHAAYGRADDLKKINGVAKVMERMLHGIGVYYFWQIAQWTREDIAHADAKLTAFHGRIQRDDWVKQASAFARAPGAAARPSEF